ncbi:hypothetical protein [Nocardia sp. XZ_19_385]|uniref:hypothetical protein n=1 Tax=Nocardia sp. XZ_19_385 TaxID=2769488 RepID=UPI00189082B0|nr:hypothetical protein [Nocardia sp. XZ_19_385]
MARMQRTKFHAPVGFLKEAKQELGYATQQEMLLELVRQDLTDVRQNPQDQPEPDSRRWGTPPPIQYPDWYYLPGDWKETAVSAPEGFLEEARRELGYPDEEQMLLDLTRDALLQHRQRESMLRIMENPNLKLLLDPDFRARARG